MTLRCLKCGCRFTLLTHLDVHPDTRWFCPYCGQTVRSPKPKEPNAH